MQKLPALSASEEVQDTLPNLVALASVAGACGLSARRYYRDLRACDLPPMPCDSSTMILPGDEVNLYSEMQVMERCQSSRRRLYRLPFLVFW